MNNFRILIVKILLTLLYVYFSNAAILNRFPQKYNDKIDDPNKRHVDKEKLKIYRIIAEHIGPSDPSAKASNDSPQYDSFEFEEKKISAIQEVVTPSLDAKGSRSIKELSIPHPNERGAPFFNNSTPYDSKLLARLEGNSYQSKKSLNMLEINDRNRLDNLNQKPMKEKSGKYKLPHTSLSNKKTMEVPSGKFFYKSSDQEDDDDLNSDYETADSEVEAVKNFHRIPILNPISTKVYKNVFTKSYGSTEAYKEYYGQNYMPTKVDNVKDNLGHVPENSYKENNKNSFIHVADVERNQDHKRTKLEKSISNPNLQVNDDEHKTLRKHDTYKSDLTTPKSFLSTIQTINESNVQIVNDTSKLLVINEGPLEIDIKTDPSTGKVNFRFESGRGPNLSLKIERKSLNFPNIDEMSQPLLKFYDNLVPSRLNHRSGDINLSVVEKSFKGRDSGNGVFYVGDVTKRSEKRDVSIMQVLKSNGIAVSLIVILSTVTIFLFLYALFNVGRRTLSGDNSKLDGRGDPKNKPKTTRFYNAWTRFTLEPITACMASNPFRNQPSRQNKISEESYISGKGEMKKKSVAIGSKREETANEMYGSQTQKRTKMDAKTYNSKEVIYPKVSTRSAPLRDILNAKLESSRNTLPNLEDSETDFELPYKQKQHKRSKYRRRPSVKRSPICPPNCDIESILSYEADQSTEDNSLESSSKPNPQNLKLKMMTTGEIKEIDKMLVGNDWSRRVYGPQPFRTTGEKGVTFSALGNTMQKACKDTSSNSATTKESTRSLEKELGKSLHKAENVIRRVKPLSKKEFTMKQY